jgi:hypothetical protein
MRSEKAVQRTQVANLKCEEMNMDARWRMRYLILGIGFFFSLNPAQASDAASPTSTEMSKNAGETAAPSSNGPGSQLAALKAQLTEQQSQILEQQRQIDELRRLVLHAAQQSAATGALPDFNPLNSTEHEISSRSGPLGEVASVVPIIPAGKAQATALTPPQSKDAVSVQDLANKTEGLLKGLNGFKFSGDFRFRADGTFRSGNSVAAPAQNVRARYRFRFNVDKEIHAMVAAHLQLSTGPLNNAITMDQDFNTIAKNPFNISEATIDFHPSKNFSLRGGRMEEAFADNMRYMWDDDVRFDGFSQITRIPLAQNALGFKSFEIRGGVYFQASPNVQVLAAGSPYVAAGFTPGQKVRDAMLYHPGFILKGELGSKWDHSLTADMQVYHNANLIQVASTTTGFPLYVNGALGITLSGPLTGGGTATTTAGGPAYAARHFQIAHVSYRLQRKGIKVGDREMPFWLDLQGSENVGTSMQRNGYMASANFGQVRKLGDFRFLYQYGYKEANAFISQFTDDDLGSGSGVNIRVHAIRFDLGIAKFLQWQNLFFIQNEISGNMTNFFVPLQHGAAPTYRYLGQLAFSF